MFVRVELVKRFQPLRENTTYGMDRLLDIGQYPLAEAITIYAITDSEVNGASIRIRVVGNDTPDPHNGLVLIGEIDPSQQITTPNSFNKLVQTIEMAKAAIPYYGVVFITGETAPSKGFCWAYADVWWPGG